MLDETSALSSQASFRQSLLSFGKTLPVDNLGKSLPGSLTNSPDIHQVVHCAASQMLDIPSVLSSQASIRRSLKLWKDNSRVDNVETAGQAY